MWLIDHQMNVELSMAVEMQRPSLPLVNSAHILNDNALRVDWEEFTPKEEIDYILGNPPFIGKKEQSKEQKKEITQIFDGVKGCGVLDYVVAWYLKAAQYIQGTEKKVAFVSTNSITMGEQVGILWSELFNKYNIKIHFAHRTFCWSSEAKGKAHVHVVIIGFAAIDTDKKYIYEYEDIKDEPHQVKVNNINPYLVEADDIVMFKRDKAISESSPSINYGSFALDDGNYTISEDEYHLIIDKEPQAKVFLRPFIGGKELINNIVRYCVWIDETNIGQVKNSKIIKEKVGKVKNWRSNRSRENTKKLAEFPTKFAEIRQPNTDFIAIPTLSSVRRKYIPIAYIKSETIASNQLYVIPNGSLSNFGILTSMMHMVWIKYVCGRLKSDYRYSNNIVYNNYPWPKNASEKQVAAIEAAAQGVLDARLNYPDSSLADLYDPLTMPPDLVKAHNALDRAVDKCYRGKAFTSETERLEYLFMLYKQYTEPLIVKETRKR
jgi:hypothetical protein